MTSLQDARASLRNGDVFMELDYSMNFTTVEAEVKGHSPCALQPMTDGCSATATKTAFAGDLANTEHADKD